MLSKQIHMSHFPQANSHRRASRVRVSDPVPVVVVQQDGKHASAKLQSISINGGLLRLAHAMSAGDFVEVAFQTQSGKVQGMAEMLAALSLNGSVLQPFRFIALGDEDHNALRNMVDLIADRRSVMAGLRL